MPPGRSALMVTPWTAVTVPRAFTVDGHCSCRAVAVVTASGGGWKLACAAMPPLIWRALTTPSAPRRAPTISSIRIILFMTTDLPLSPTLSQYEFLGPRLPSQGDSDGQQRAAPQIGRTGEAGFDTRAGKPAAVSLSTTQGTGYYEGSLLREAFRVPGSFE